MDDKVDVIDHNWVDVDCGRIWRDWPGRVLVALVIDGHS